MSPCSGGAVDSFPIVGVGASAGGLPAFTELLRALPPDTGMAFVLIQHLDPSHPSYLSEALARTTKLPVDEVRDGMQVQPGHVYVIPSDADVGIRDGALRLLPRRAQERQLHLPIDHFLKALAADRRSQAIGVVLTGTGSDGAEGLRAIKSEGGVTFAQAPQSAQFRGMPDAAIKTGAVDVVLPIPELARELVRIGHDPFFRGQEALESPSDAGALGQVLTLLRKAVGVDFTGYKHASIRRRLARRMALHRQTTLPEYVSLLREKPGEPQALLDDLLIHVTSFFRDAQTFDALKKLVYPNLLRQKRNGGTIRIWCAGCSTGEEAYSLIISLLEFLSDEAAETVQIQLFGTDISEQAIEKARAGVYSAGAMRDVAPERLERFFTKVEGGYRINKTVRTSCAFVRHDIDVDPPFSRIDLVSCRNVLIYFGPEMQKRALTTFQFSLNQPGFLVLGRAENVTEGPGLFSALDPEHKIFERIAGRSSLRFSPARESSAIAWRLAEPSPRPLMTAEVGRRLENLLLDRYAPPGVAVDDRMEILHFRGRTGEWLEPAPGVPKHDLSKMARRGLVPDLLLAISQAKHEEKAVRRPGVRVGEEGSAHICDLVVVPIPAGPGSEEPLFAVLFEAPEAREDAFGGGGQRRAPGPPEDDQRVMRLEEEVRANHDRLQSIVEEHQRTNEDLMSANEELMSSNEELQSLNEELETAQEELQSTNEELTTLNEELQTRQVELDLVNGDLLNVLKSVEIPIVIVDRDRRIRRYTPMARTVLNLLPSDVGRPIDDIRPTLLIEDFDRKIAQAIDAAAMHEEEVFGPNGRWYRLQVRPYMNVDQRVDGAVVSIIDIDVLKRSLDAAERARDYARATVEAVQTPLLVLDGRLDVASANEAFQERYGITRVECEGQSLFEIMNGAWDMPELRSALVRVVQGGDERFQKLEVEREIPRLGMRSLSLSGRSVPMPTGERIFLLAAEDITERLRGEAERAHLLEAAREATASAEDANRTKDLFLATLSHELRTPLSTLLMQSQLIRRGKLDDAKLRKAGEAIERATKAQAQLVGDLLDVARIEAGKLKIDMEEVTLASVVQAAADTIGPIAEKKGVELELRLDETLAPVRGDPQRLQQVVLNLLTNAIKFTPERGYVRVTVDAQGDEGRIQVMDTGIGIDPEFLPHLFERFTQQERGQAHAHAGLGLGLSIVQHLVEAHGGTIQAHSAGRGEGATFTVLLPMEKKNGTPAQ